MFATSCSSAIPGTGKTTVARLVAGIYRAIGVLAKGHLVECDRSELVAGYLGQTALKTAEVIDSALGGALFIDEAYSLAQDDFGSEAIDTLVKEMEDHRDELVVIVVARPKAVSAQNQFVAELDERGPQSVSSPPTPPPADPPAGIPHRL